jgi:ElaB/YqjD/DUF883 family membrane-anchored ribosome-binding protein
MNTAAQATQNIRDTVKDAREGVREVRQATAGASADIQSDLQALRDDFARLADQISAIIGQKGTAAWQRARSSVDSVMSDAQDKGRDTVDAMRDLSGDVVGAIGDSIKQRPYTTLAIVAAIGFLFGATWKR